MLADAPAALVAAATTAPGGSTGTASGTTAKSGGGGGGPHAALALLALSAVLDGVTAGGRWGSNQPGQPQQQHVSQSSPAALGALAPSSSTDEAVRRLAGVCEKNRSQGL